MSKKLTYDHVKNSIELFGYKLLSEEYKNNNTKMKLQCPKGHIFWMSFACFKKGQRCPECAKKKYGQTQRFTHDYVKNYIEEQEHILLSQQYKNVETKLKLECPDGHIFWMNFNHFKKGHRCPECAGNRKLTNQEIIESLDFCENIRENSNKQIEIACANCDKWFIPERKYLTQRIQYVNGENQNERRLYCSQNCKDACPIFNQTYYPKGNKPYLDREVQGELAEMVLERDNYTCYKCGYHKDELDCSLHCHHTWPLNESPVTSADMGECKTTCADCHIWIHKTVPGCGYGEMRCSY